MKKTGKQSKNVQDRTNGWGLGSDTWNNIDTPRPKDGPISNRVSNDLEVGRMRARQSQEMRDRIKGRTRISNATYVEVIKNKTIKKSKKAK